MNSEKKVEKYEAPSNGHDWTRGNLTGNLLHLTWPIMISDTLNTIGPTIDLIFIGMLGSVSVSAQAGMGISGNVFMIVVLCGIGINMGIRAVIGRYVGAGGQDDKINHVMMQAIIINLIYGAGIAVIGIVLARPILALFRLEPDVLNFGVAYMRIVFIGAIPMALHMMCEAFMQASGDTIRPMILSAIMRVVHVATVPVFVLGVLTFPGMGVKGAATAQVLSLFCGSLVGLWFVFTGRSMQKVSLKKCSVDIKTTWHILRIGLPAMVMFGQRGFARLVLMGLIVPFGTLAVTSWAILQRIELFVTMPVFGFGRASGVLVCQNLGAGQPERAAKSAWIAVGLSAICLLISTIAMFLWPELIIRVFNRDPELIIVGSVYLQIFLISFLFISLDVVLINSLTSAGDTLVPMLITLARMWIISIPLGVVLSKYTGLGGYGVVWGLVTGMIMGSIACAIYFQSGRWKRKKL
ncbi:MAG: MATE family efflux transporter [Deltaproteobacteria bacterium]|nr:MATE family efflux transporter [Deltaproteobacteria bacterium]